MKKLLAAAALAVGSLAVAVPAEAAAPSGYAIEFCVHKPAGTFYTAEVIKGGGLYLWHTGAPITPGQWSELPDRALSSSKPVVDAWITNLNVATVYHVGC